MQLISDRAVFTTQHAIDQLGYLSVRLLYKRYGCAEIAVVEPRLGHGHKPGRAGARTPIQRQISVLLFNGQRSARDNEIGTAAVLADESMDCSSIEFLFWLRRKCWVRR